jgi:2-C-methyl-D-erythritol 4-phosphate cytidylyltransferase
LIHINESRHGFTFNSLNESFAQAFATSAARLDQLEVVNDYGREPAKVQGLPAS